MRERFVAARAYADALARAGDDPQKAPERDLGKEALLEVLDGSRIVHHHTHRHDDILTVLRLREEFGFRCVLHHVSEGALPTCTPLFTVWLIVVIVLIGTLTFLPALALGPIAEQLLMHG